MWCRFSCVFCVAVGIDAAAALIMRDHRNLTRALANINGADVAFPAWLNGGVNPIPDIATLLQDILTYVATVSGGVGVVGNCRLTPNTTPEYTNINKTLTLLAPNTIPQYANSNTSLFSLGYIPIFRAINPAHLPIGSNYIIADSKRKTTAIAAPVLAPPAAVGSAIIL